MESVRPIAEAAFGYLKQHPDELLRVLRSAIALRFGLPIPALRWLLGRTRARNAPKDLEISAIPPGVHVGGSFELMGTPLRASADLYVERVRASKEELRFDIRLANVKLRVLDDKVESPLSALLRSGALDLSKPGNLVAYMPKRPAILVEARDDRLSIDLYRHPKVARDPRVKRLLAVLLPLVTVSAVETEGDHLDVALRPFPAGVSQAWAELRRAF